MLISSSGQGSFFKSLIYDFFLFLILDDLPPITLACLMPSLLFTHALYFLKKTSRWKSAWPLPHYWLLLLFLSRFPIRLLPFPSLPSQTSYLHLLLCLQTCSWWNPNGDGEEMTWGLLHHNSRYCSCSCAFFLDLNYLWKETICISSTHVQDLEYLTQYYFMKSLSFNTVNIWHLHSTFELDAILKAVHILPHLLHATTLWEKALTQTESHLIRVLPNTEFY